MNQSKSQSQLIAEELEQRERFLQSTREERVRRAQALLKQCR